MYTFFSKIVKKNMDFETKSVLNNVVNESDNLVSGSLKVFVNAAYYCINVIN